MKRYILETEDGSKTLYIPEMDEQYHSVKGALTEALHVYITNGFKAHESQNPCVFEVGFGTGLNAMLTAIECQKLGRTCQYIGIERYPVTTPELEQLGYENLFEPEQRTIFKQLHQTPWNETTELSKEFRLLKIKADLLSYNLDNLPHFDVVYFDAFGPDKQSEMWGKAIFQKIFKHCNQEAILVTYSAKGEIRRRLQSIGFQMERLPGPPGKREMLRGKKV